MNLQQRAQALVQLGLLPKLDAAGLKKLVSDAEIVTGVEIEEGPATALLLAAGRVLEIHDDGAHDLEEYVDLFEHVANFLGFKIEPDDVKAVMISSEEVDEDAEAEVEEDPEFGNDDPDYPSTVPPENATIEFEYALDGKTYKSEICFSRDILDLSFLGDFVAHLASKGVKEELCPLVELMDDVARYVLSTPAVMEKAEADEVIAAPDFEQEEE